MCHSRRHITYIRINWYANTAGGRVNTERGLQQVVSLLGDFNIKSGISVIKGHFSDIVH